jgi:hypothetical protein
LSGRNFARLLCNEFSHSLDHLATAANRLDSLFGGYDLATPEKEKRVSG